MHTRQSLRQPSPPEIDGSLNKPSLLLYYRGALYRVTIRRRKLACIFERNVGAILQHLKGTERRYQYQPENQSTLVCEEAGRERVGFTYNSASLLQSRAGICTRPESMR